MGKKYLLAYLAYPYSADPKRYTQEIFEIAVKIISKFQLNKEIVPVVPHLMFDPFHHHVADELILEWELETISRCDIFVVCSDKLSPGMMWELAYAQRLGKPIYELEEILK